MRKHPVSAAPSLKSVCPIIRHIPYQPSPARHHTFIPAYRATPAYFICLGVEGDFQSASAGPSFRSSPTYWCRINRGTSLDGGCIGDNFAELLYLGFEAWMSRPGAAIIKPVPDIDYPHDEALKIDNQGSRKGAGPYYAACDSVKKLGCPRA